MLYEMASHGCLPHVRTAYGARDNAAPPRIASVPKLPDGIYYTTIDEIDIIESLYILMVPASGRKDVNIGLGAILLAFLSLNATAQTVGVPQFLTPPSAEIAETGGN